MADRENALPELDGLAEYFDRAIRMRGAEYVKNGSVIEPHVFGKMLTARVRGGEIYKVEIDWSDGETNYNCTCPYSKQHGACKHIWATLLLGAEKKFLPRELAQEVLQSHSTAAAPIAEDEEEEIDPEIDADVPAGSSMVMPGFRAPRATIEALPEGSKAPAWKMQLRKLAEHVQAEAPPPPPMDPLREKKLFYVVNASATLDDDDGNLVVDLFAAKLGKTGAPTPPKQVRLSRGEVASILDPVEQNLLRVLAGMQQGYFDFNEIGPRFGLDGKRDRTIVPPALPEWAVGLARSRRQAAARAAADVGRRTGLGIPSSRRALTWPKGGSNGPAGYAAARKRSASTSPTCSSARVWRLSTARSPSSNTPARGDCYRICARRTNSCSGKRNSKRCSRSF